jgi:hypothetical protein
VPLVWESFGAGLKEVGEYVKRLGKDYAHWHRAPPSSFIRKATATLAITLARGNSHILRIACARVGLPDPSVPLLPRLATRPTFQPSTLPPVASARVHTPRAPRAPPAPFAATMLPAAHAPIPFRFSAPSAPSLALLAALPSASHSLSSSVVFLSSSPPVPAPGHTPARAGLVASPLPPV